MITIDGLPPDGNPRRFIGFDKNGTPYLLAYIGAPGHEGWGAIGFEADEVNTWHPLAVMCIGDDSNFIKSYAITLPEIE